MGAETNPGGLTAEATLDATLLPSPKVSVMCHPLPGDAEKTHLSSPTAPRFVERQATGAIKIQWNRMEMASHRDEGTEVLRKQKL